MGWGVFGQTFKDWARNNFPVSHSSFVRSSITKGRNRTTILHFDSCSLRTNGYELNPSIKRRSYCVPSPKYRAD